MRENKTSKIKLLINKMGKGNDEIESALFDKNYRTKQSAKKSSKKTIKNTKKTNNLKSSLSLKDKLNVDGVKLLKNERLDDLQYNGLKIIQNKNLYCFSGDAVLLCNFVKAKKTDTILDLCSGSGVVGILAQAKTDASNLVMIEKQKELADMCERSLQLNKLTQKAKVFCCDIEKTNEILKTYYNKNAVEVVCSNPPYYLPTQKKLSGNKKIDIAKFEIELNLDKLCKVASSVLTYGGKFFMVNDSERISEIICALKKYNLEPKIIEFVYPKQSKSSNVVLIQSTKGGKPGAKVYYKNI